MSLQQVQALDVEICDILRKLHETLTKQELDLVQSIIEKCGEIRRIELKQA